MTCRAAALFVAFLSLSACGSDSESDSPGAAGTGGSAGTSSGGGDAGGSAGTSSGGGDAGGLGEGGAAGAPSSVDLGELDGAAFSALGSNAFFNEVPDRAYVSISVYGWAETCSTDPQCNGAQLNFTLYAIGGTLDDLQPGTYSVGEVVDGDVTFEVVGAAGRYDSACSTGDGFDPLASGTLTIAAIAGGRVQGELDFTLEGGDALSGSFDAVDCTP